MHPPGRDLAPWGAVTGIGSLPFEDEGEAFDFVLRHAPELPFVPQLPRVEPMLRESLAPLALDLAEQTGGFVEIRGATATDVLRLLDRAARDGLPPDPRALRFSERLSAEGINPVAVKAQLVGPATFGACVRVGGKPLAGEPRAEETIVRFLTARAASMLSALRTAASTAVFLWDEPVLSETGPAAALVRCIEAVSVFGAVSGFHSCAAAAPPREALRASGCTALALSVADGSSERAKGLVDLVKRGGIAAFGVVPTSSDAPFSVPDAADWFERVARAGAIESRELLRRSLITAECGTGTLTAERSLSVFRLAHELSAELRRRYRN